MTDERRGGLAVLLLAFLTFGGCSTVGRLVAPESPHDGYASMLRRSGVDQTSLVYDVERDGAHAVRLQPELLRGGNFTLTQRTLASLTFPVVGLTSHHVQSLFGAARDAGAREHQGVDIFAPRGTAVVAVADGTAHSDTNGLGGNVVWLRTSLGGPRFYYAHLDRWEIDGNARVRVGDVHGYVGNTGNARTTAPHLHVGVYDGGAISPLPFIEPDDAIPVMTPPPPELGALMRIVVARATLRAGPGTNHPELTSLDRHVPLRVHGLAADWYRVSTPNATTGYVASRLVGPLAPPLRVARLRAGTIVRERPDPTSPVMAVVDAPSRADTLAEFNDYALLQLANGRTGWVDARQD